MLPHGEHFLAWVTIVVIVAAIVILAVVHLD